MHDHASEKALKIGIALTAIFFVVEVIGGLVSGSLALLGDAGHMLRDVFALFMSLGALHVAQKVPTEQRTFGYHRVEVFAAFLNGLMLLGISGWIFFEAYNRFLNPQPIQSVTMLGVAMVGLIVNAVIASMLHGSEDVNVKSAFLHVLTDLIASIAVIAAAIWIFFTDMVIVDPLLSVAIAVLVLVSAAKILKESTVILLEYTPEGIDLEEVIATIESVEGVDGAHNVHFWTLCSNVNVLDAHVLTDINDMGEIELIKDRIKQELEQYDVKHSTLEFECESCRVPEDVKHIEH